MKRIVTLLLVSSVWAEEITHIIEQVQQVRATQGPRASLQAGYTACATTLTQEIATALLAGAVGGQVGHVVLHAAGEGVASVTENVVTAAETGQQAAQELAAEEAAVAGSGVNTEGIIKSGEAGEKSWEVAEQLQSNPERHAGLPAGALAQAGVAEGTIVSLPDAVATRPSIVQACYLAVEQAAGFRVDTTTLFGRYAYIALDNQTGAPLTMVLNWVGGAPQTVTVPATGADGVQHAWAIGGLVLTSVTVQQAGAQPVVMYRNGVVGLNEVIGAQVRVNRSARTAQLVVSQLQGLHT